MTNADAMRLIQGDVIYGVLDDETVLVLTVEENNLYQFDRVARRYPRRVFGSLKVIVDHAYHGGDPAGLFTIDSGERVAQLYPWVLRYFQRARRSTRKGRRVKVS